MMKRKRAAWIRYRLALQGKTVADLAASLGVTPRMAHYVITGERKSRRLREGMAAILGTTVERLWGKEKETREARADGAQEKRRAAGG